LQVLLELLVEPQALKKDVIDLLTGALKISIAARPVPVPPIRLNITRPVEDRPSSEPPPTQVLSALSRLTLYRIQERAQVAAEAGEYDAASRHLHNLATHLLSQGETSLAKTALFEAENLERMHAWSASGSKDIKYSTRALLLTSAKEGRV
jgi:Ca-activated chloride channel family protein